MTPQFHFIVIVVLVGLALSLEYYHMVRHEKKAEKEIASPTPPKKRWWLNNNETTGAIFYGEDSEYAKFPDFVRLYGSLAFSIGVGAAILFHKFSPYPAADGQRLLLSIGIVGLLPLLIAIVSSLYWKAPLRCGVQLLAAELKPLVIYSILAVSILFAIAGWISLMPR